MKRIYSLDIVKFFMSIFLVYFHCVEITGITDIIQLYTGNKIMLLYMVEMFYIISGFLIAGGLDKIRQMDFKDYIVKKIVRIYPVAMLSVCVAAVIGFVYYKLYNEFFLGIKISLWNLLTSLLLVNSGGVLKMTFAINSPLWYLEVLMYCYIITYFILWISNKLKVRSIYFFIGMICLGISLIQYETELPFLTPLTGRGYSSFFLGIILFYIWKSVSHSGLFVYSVICIILCACAYVFERNLYLDGQRDVLTFILFPALLFFFLVLDEHMDLSFVRSMKLGDVSYEIYVWHYCVISLIMLLDKRYGFVAAHERRTLLIIILTVIILSFIVNRCIETKMTGYLMSKYNKAVNSDNAK